MPKKKLARKKPVAKPATTEVAQPLAAEDKGMEPVEEAAPAQPAQPAEGAAQ